MTRTDPKTIETPEETSRTTFTGIGLGVLFWLLFATLLANQTIVAHRLIDGSAIAWPEALSESLLVSAFWGFASILIFRLIRRYLFFGNHGWFAVSIRHLLLAATLLVVSLAVYIVLAPADLKLAVPTTTVKEKLAALAYPTLFSTALFYGILSNPCLCCIHQYFNR